MIEIYCFPPAVSENSAKSVRRGIPDSGPDVEKDKDNCYTLVSLTALVQKNRPCRMRQDDSCISGGMNMNPWNRKYLLFLIIISIHPAKPRRKCSFTRCSAGCLLMSRGIS